MYSQGLKKKRKGSFGPEEHKWSKGLSFGGRHRRNGFENWVVSIGTDNKSGVMWLEAPSGGLYMMFVK